MKKLAAFAVFAALTASTAMANAASLDPAGMAEVGIKAPTTNVSVAATNQVVFDSAGNFTAAQVETVNPKVIPIRDENKVCLDSSCNTIL
ncbi:MAG: hypothetical protein WA666_06665 [Nitrospirota bacterium]